MAVISFKCPNCDAELIFEPNQQTYKCEYCGSDFSQDELDKINSEMKKAQSEEQETDEPNMLFYNCPSCGAEVVTEETTAATFCYYCHNPIILEHEIKGNYKPDVIIPFQIEKKRAETSFLDYVQKRKFVPANFFSKQQIEKLSGVYFPYWLYDAELSGEMRAEGKKIRTWVVKDEQFTETKIYEIERKGKIELRNLPAHALKKANGKLVESVFPYRLEEGKPFTAGYLSGFLAERRDVEQEEIAEKMKQEMKEHAEHMVKNQIEGYNSVKVSSSHFQIKKDRFQYALLPIWSITYKGKDGTIYYYSMNGQTGTVCGKLPIDYKKLSIVSAAVGLAAFMLVLLGGYFLW